MRRKGLILLAVTGLLLTSPVLVRQSTRRPAQRVASDRVLELVPASAPLAADLSAVTARWSELRAQPKIATLQDSVLACFGLQAELIPRLAGERMLMFLARSEAPAPVSPVLLVVGPKSLPDSMAALSGVPEVCSRVDGDVLWVGPAGAEATLEALARREGPSLAAVLPIDEAEDRLPPGGLVRGWVNPGAVIDLLRDSSIDRGPAPLRLLADVVSANLAAVRYAAFRRDLNEGELTTDAIVAYDMTRLPSKISSVFDPSVAGVKLPAEALDAGDTAAGTALAVAAFRPEARAWIPRLKFVAASDPRGPLRNLGFWLDDFERRFGHDLERDLCDAIGERGWLLVTKPADGYPPDLVLITETHPTSATEQTLADLLAWAGEQVWVRSLGAVMPTLWRDQHDGGAVHGLTLRAPLMRSAAGPCFQLTERYLFVATRPEALAAGKTWIQRVMTIEAASSQFAGDPTVHGSILVRASALAGLIADAGGQLPNDQSEIRQAIAALLGGVESLNGNLTYDRDAIRLHGRIRLASK